MITLYDAARCPYCARVRIVLAEKGIPHESVEIDLANRPGWIYEKNATGRVPVVEEDTFVLPESHLIMDYLEERYPDPALAPADPGLRALERLRIVRFDDELGNDYYAFRRGESNNLVQRLRELDVARLPYGLAAIAYVPWVIRVRDMLGVQLPAHVDAWLGGLSERSAIRAELDLVAAM